MTKMKVPSDLMSELAEESLKAKQSIKKWREWLLELRSSVDEWILHADNDIKDKKK